MSIGLALSGGGARGIAHIGILEALKDYKIKVDYIAGTSSGSVFASMYAAGFLPNEMLRIIEYNKDKLIDYDKSLSIKLLGSLFSQRLSIKGFVKGKKLESLLDKFFHEKNIKDISDIKFPLAIPTVDLRTGELVYYTNSKNIEESKSCIENNINECQEEVNENEMISNEYIENSFFDDKESYFKKGKIAEIVRASCSFPGIFVPKKIEDKEYIDGGVRVCTPVEVLKKMGATKIIAITFDCNKRFNYSIKNIAGISEQAFNIISHTSAYEEQSKADLNIRLCLNNVSLLDFSKPYYVARRGYNIVARNIEEIKRRLNIN